MEHQAEETKDHDGSSSASQCLPAGLTRKRERFGQGGTHETPGWKNRNTDTSFWSMSVQRKVDRKATRVESSQAIMFVFKEK